MAGLACILPQTFAHGSQLVVRLLAPQVFHLVWATRGSQYITIIWVLRCACETV